MILRTGQIYFRSLTRELLFEPSRPQYTKVRVVSFRWIIMLVVAIMLIRVQQTWAMWLLRNKKYNAYVHVYFYRRRV